MLIDEFLDLCYYAAERLGRAIVTDGITTPVVNTSAYFFKKTADLIDFKVYFFYFVTILLEARTKIEISTPIII